MQMRRCPSYISGVDFGGVTLGLVSTAALKLHLCLPHLEITGRKIYSASPIAISRRSFFLEDDSWCWSSRSARPDALSAIGCGVEFGENIAAVVVSSPSLGYLLPRFLRRLDAFRVVIPMAFRTIGKDG